MKDPNRRHYPHAKKTNPWAAQWGYGLRMKTHYQNPQKTPLISTKAGTFPLPRHHFIDTAPLCSRYDILAKAVLAMTLAGQHLQALLATRKIIRLVRIVTRLEAHNVQLRRKLDMLSNGSWRERVLRELGGMRKLKLWDAAKARIEARAAAAAKPAPAKGPSWLYTPERLAESERLKARVRFCRRAGQNPLIVRDLCKVDSEGEFRLAPLPRNERRARQMRVYTQSSIFDYEFNPVPFAKETGFGRAMVWPAEFYAAIKIEAQSDRNRASGTMTTERRSRKTSDIKEERDQKREGCPTPLASLSPQDVLPLKIQRDIFIPLPQETPPACS